MERERERETKREREREIHTHTHTHAHLEGEGGEVEGDVELLGLLALQRNRQATPQTALQGDRERRARRRSEGGEEC
eukprot:626782-Rhodomonas_salina.2